MTLPKEEHGLRFDTPAQTWDEGLPLGNGILGALVWGDGRPLNISLDRADLWDLRQIPEFHGGEYSYKMMRQWVAEGRQQELERLYEHPYWREAPTKIPAGRIEMNVEGGKFRWTSLPLDTPIAAMNFSDGIAARVMVHAEEPVGAMLLRTHKKVSAQLKAPDFSGGEQAQKGTLGRLGYPPVQVFSSPDACGFLQLGLEGFSFAVWLCWRKTERSWLGTWSIASSSEGSSPLAIARRRAEEACVGGFQKLAASHRAWWHSYWNKSSLSVPNAALERQYFREQYKFGAASRKGSPPLALQGPWTVDDGKCPPWHGDYHHDLNTQLCYWPYLAANRIEEGENFLEWLWKTRPACRDWTRRFFDMPGLNVPMTADLNNEQIGGWYPFTHAATTGAWLCHHFYRHWKYTADEVFLRERAYPYLHESCIFIEAVTAEKDAQGRRTLPLSSSPEMNNNRLDAFFPSATNFDLALMHWLLAATAELAEHLKQADDAAHWRAIRAELPPLALAEDGRLLVAKDCPLKISHRHHSHMLAIHPLGLIDFEQGEAARCTISANLAELERLGTQAWTGYSFAWLALFQARARNGAAAEKVLEIFASAFCLRNSFHSNGDQSGKGYSSDTGRPFTLEGNFAAAEALQEMLLQSHTGRIHLFPAVPESWREVSFSNLRAQGAFLVSARRLAGKTKRIEIFSEKGGVCRIVSPVTGKELSFDTEPRQRVSLTFNH